MKLKHQRRSSDSKPLKGKLGGRSKSKLSKRKKKNENKAKHEFRWTKGHSCLSNPTKTTHRDKASSQNVFQNSFQNPLLTEKNVLTTRTSESDDDRLSENIGAMSVSDGGSFETVSTFRTFASDWSQCSNQTFNKFLHKVRLDSALHKDMLHILAATTEVIKEAGGSESDTEYFATFISTLESSDADKYQPMMELLNIVIGKVPISVLMHKAEPVLLCITKILRHGLDNDDYDLMRSCLKVLQAVLKDQDDRLIQSSLKISSVIYIILECTLQEKSKIRKRARQVIGSILKESEGGEDKKLVFTQKLIFGWILDQFAVFPNCAIKIVGNSLNLLLYCWELVDVSTAETQKLLEAVLRVMSSGNDLVTKCSLSFFSSVFEKTVDVSQADRLGLMKCRLFTAIWSMRPDTRNKETFLTWLKCTLAGLIDLKTSKDVLASLPQLLDILTPIYFSNFGDVISTLVHKHMPHIIDTSTNVQMIESCMQSISKGLISVPPNLNALKVLSSVLHSVSENQICDSAQGIFRQLVPLRGHDGVSYTIGKFIAAYGVENLWSTNDPAFQFAILPMIRDNLSNGNIEFWKQHIFPAITPRTELMTWEALTGFCRSPKDPLNFPAELVGKAISLKPHIRLPALAALRQFIMWAQCRETAVKFTKNYVPLLFNLYIKDFSADNADQPGAAPTIGHRDAVASTIKEYLPICDQEYLAVLMQTAMNKVQQEPKNSAVLLDLISYLIELIDDIGYIENLILVLKEVLQSENSTKRCYRVLSALIKSEKVDVNVIVTLLRENKGKGKSNAKGVRLGCLLRLIEKDARFIQEFLPEGILSLSSVNSKARKLAKKYTSVFCDYVKNSENPMGIVTEIVNLGLESPRELIQSSTLRFLILVYEQLKPLAPKEDYINICLKLLQESGDPGVCTKALEFLTLNMSLYKSKMGPFASTIGKVLSEHPCPRKQLDNILVEMIKTFGLIGLKAVFPKAGDPKYRIHLKNLNKALSKKLETKKKKKKESFVDDNDDSGSDSDDDVFGKQGISASEPLVMKEDIVDFLDPGAVTSSLVAQRDITKGHSSSQFKLSADGRLIIEDVTKSENSDGTPEIGSDDEEDIEFKRLKRKRKHGGSVKSGASSRKSSKSKYSQHKGEQRDSLRKKLKGKRRKYSKVL